MKTFKVKRVLLFGLVLFCSNGFAQQTSVAQQQNQAVQEIMVALNQSSNEIGQQIFTEPQRAADAGCLDGIKGIDLSVFRIDITSAWTALTSQIKDQILNGTCSAATDWANEQTTALDTNMDIPYGLGNISLSQGNAVGDWQSVIKQDVEMTSEELSQRVTTGTLGQVPNRTIPSAAADTLGSNENTPSNDKEELEKELPKILNFKQLWKDPEQ
ncbi:MAG: hypothetical protein K0U41_08710 [Gammaproteobacteria bacterium]|nr:hypothetical protein [Gammaproteobacteria bacterium]